MVANGQMVGMTHDLHPAAWVAGGGLNCDLRLLSVKTISVDFALLSFRLFS